MHVELAPRRREAVFGSGSRTGAVGGGELGPGHIGDVEGVKVVERTWVRGWVGG
jgi:hypothetical protein